MSETFALVQGLVASGEVKISEHGYDELADDGIGVSEILAGVGAGLPAQWRPEGGCFSWSSVQT